MDNITQLENPIQVSIPKTINVLLIDDDSMFARLTQHVLSRFEGREFHLTWKSDAEEALNEIRTRTDIDIILTDYMMPGLNGLDFCLQLNELESTIPVIFITSAKEFQLVIDAMKLGVEEFVLKEELVGPTLPRTIINVYETVKVRRITQAVEKRLLMSEKRAQAIKEIVVTVCHEFNNPLAAVKIGCDLAKRQKLGEEEKTLFKEFEVHFGQVQEAIDELRDLNFEKFEFKDIPSE
jgi:PleD family two-component response regulator